jgi:D-beta-D-heptose 7-phosphate kinase / D-beta-D-heptose 1-phosphate adenosyltransferase
MTNLQNNNPKILVVGDLIIDQYLWGDCDRISPEAPVQVIDIKKDSKVLGGAGNVVNNLKKLGAKVDILSVIGDCNTSSELLDLLKKIDVGTNFLVKQNGRILSKKTRIISSQQQVVRYDRESNNSISAESEKALLKKFNDYFKDYEVILLSDYGKGVLTTKVSKALIKLANTQGIRVLVDPKGNDFSKYNGAFLLTPNKKEASKVTNINIDDEQSLLQAITKLKIELNLSISIITMSELGIAVFDNKLRIKPTITKEVFDITGAGDTVLSSLGFALACNSSIDDAVEFSNLAAGVVVSKIGSATATMNEIIEHESSLNQSSGDKHIKNFSEINLISKNHKANNRKIIFTNGCFDIIHLGHVQYLEKAKSLGDILIVGLNSDKSISNLKGANRPINSEDDRAYILAALESVDYVVIFDELSPHNLIKLIHPDILVKGADYEGKEVIGQEVAAELKLIEYVSGRSTSNIIKKIKNLN